MKGIDALLSSTAGQYAVLAAIGGVVFLVVHNLLKADIKEGANAIGDGVSDIAEGIGGIATGHNTITADTPYEGAGVFGTLGAASNEISGGLFSRVGEWLGGGLADIKEYWSDDDNLSSSFQHSNNNPYGYGTSKSYQDAANLSPVPATATASPWAINPDFRSFEY